MHNRHEVLAEHNVWRLKLAPEILRLNNGIDQEIWIMRRWTFLWCSGTREGAGEGEEVPQTLSRCVHWYFWVYTLSSLE